MHLATITWLIVGSMIGFFAGGNLRQSFPEMALNIALGMAGAMAAGWAFLYFASTSMPGLELYAIAVAAVGAAIIPTIYRAATAG